MLTVAIYLRKSRSDIDFEKENEVDTLKKHRQMLMDFANKNGYIVLDIFEEIVSGDSLFSRPQMLELLKKVESKSYEAVLCVDLDRLGRGSKGDQALIEQTFKLSHTKIVTLRKTYDLENEYDEDFMEFETFMARRELSMIKRRMKRGIIETVKRGGYGGGKLPFGYKRVFVDNKKKIVINEDERKIVEFMFNSIDKGLSPTEIRSQLREMGHYFLYHKIKYILFNKIYMGLYSFLKTKTVVSKNNKKVKIKMKEEEAIYKKYPDCEFEPIIDEELFLRVQKRLVVHYPATKKHTVLRNPFASLVFCKHCNYRLQLKQVGKEERKTYFYFHCDQNSCFSCPFLKIEKAVLSELNRVFLDEEFSDSEDHSEFLKEIQQTIERKEKELIECEEQRLRLFELVERGIYDGNVFLERSEELKNRKSKIVNTIQELKNEKLTLIEMQSKRSIIRPKVLSLIDIYQSLNAEEKNQLLRKIIKKIEVGKDNRNISIKVYFFF